MTAQSRKFEIKIYRGSGEKCIECKQTIPNESKFVEVEVEKEINRFYNPGKYHLLCIAKQNYFIAFIDILGFSKLTFMRPLDELYEIIEDLFGAARSSRVEASVGTDTRTIAEAPYIILSDAIVLYQIVRPPFDKKDFFEWKEKIFGQFLSSLEGIFQEAFKRNLHLRAGVSYGECYISPNSSEESTRQEHILIGKPFTEAVKLEGIQSWMGVAFHPSIKDYLEKSSLKETLIKAEIPLKDRSCVIPPYTIAWVDASMEPYKYVFEKWQTEGSRQEEIKSNTLKFFEKHIRTPPPIRHFGAVRFI